MSYDHDADFTPHFEQYRQCLADHVIDCLGFWDALKFNSKVIDRDAAAISRCSGHGLGYSIYATPRCSVVEIRGGSSKLNDLASIVHVMVELMQKYAKVDRIVGTDKFDSLWSWQLL